MERYSGAGRRAERKADMRTDKETEERTHRHRMRRTKRADTQVYRGIVKPSYLLDWKLPSESIIFFVSFVSRRGAAPPPRRLSVRDQRRECWLRVKAILVILLDSRERRLGQAGRVLQFWLLVEEMDAAALRAKPVLRGFTHEATMECVMNLDSGWFLERRGDSVG